MIIPRRAFIHGSAACLAGAALAPGMARLALAGDTFPHQVSDMSDQIPLATMTNGLTAQHDYFFPAQPANPDMREGTSIWLFEENGEFAFPRMGVEGEAHSWDTPQYHVNVALGDNRVMQDSDRAPAPPVLGSDGKPSVFGAGPLVFRCLDPFRRWVVSYSGMAHHGTLSEQIAGTLHSRPQVPVTLEAELAMVTPAWVQDYSPEKVAKMSKAERDDVQNMGIGWRLEHLFRGTGTLTVDGVRRDFRCQGSRIKRQSVRPLSTFRGHCWQSAVFPDGRAFGYIAYPPSADSGLYQIGYVYLNGKMYPARPVTIPFISEVLESGDDVSLELESELGIHRIAGSTLLSTFRVNNPEMAALGAVGFTLQQSGARYTWDGMSSIGMIERSATGDQMSNGYPRY